MSAFVPISSRVQGVPVTRRMTTIGRIAFFKLDVANPIAERCDMFRHRPRASRPGRRRVAFCSAGVPTQASRPRLCAETTHCAPRSSCPIEIAAIVGAERSLVVHLPVV
jgi:hypothetical protein